MTGRTEDLIVALAADASPVQRLEPIRTRLLRWFGVPAATGAAGVWAFGPRGDLGAALGETGFVVDGLLTIGTGALAAAGAFVLSVPGAERTRLQRWLPPAGLTAWAAFLSWRFAGAGGSWADLAAEPWHLACAARILSIAALPAIAGFLMIRRAAPLDLDWTAALTSLACLALATLAVQIVCPFGTTAHVIVAHLVPLTGLLAVGTVAGARVFRT